MSNHKTYYGFFKSDDEALVAFKQIPNSGSVRGANCFSQFFLRGKMEENFDTFYFGKQIQKNFDPVKIASDFNKEVHNIQLKLCFSIQDCLFVYHPIYSPEFISEFKVYSNYILHHYIRMFGVDESWARMALKIYSGYKKPERTNYLNFACRINNSFYDHYRTLYEGKITKKDLLSVDNMIYENFKDIDFKDILNSNVRYYQSSIINFMKLTNDINFKRIARKEITQNLLEPGMIIKPMETFLNIKLAKIISILSSSVCHVRILKSSVKEEYETDMNVLKYIEAKEYHETIQD